MVIDWLADVLRATGYPVIEEGNWRARTTGGTFKEVRGVLMHHTAGGMSTHSSRNVVINGRPGLAGPLCHVYVCREPAFHVVSGRRSSHAGLGGHPWTGVNAGNSYLVGFECENTGLGEPWTNLYPIMVAGAGAVLKQAGLPAGRCTDHKEYAPRRKPDRAGIDPARFRADVAAWLKGSPQRPQGPQKPIEEDDVKPEDVTAIVKAVVDTLGARFSTIESGVASAVAAAGQAGAVARQTLDLVTLINGEVQALTPRVDAQDWKLAKIHEDLRHNYWSFVGTPVLWRDLDLTGTWGDLLANPQAIWGDLMLGRGGSATVAAPK